MSLWFGETDFAVRCFGAVFETQLGKMLQPEPNGPDDRLRTYLKASDLSGGGVSGAVDQMWASAREVSAYSVRDGDLLIVEGGDVGQSAIYRGAPVLYQNSLHRVRSTSVGDVGYAKFLLDALVGSGFLEVLCSRATIRHFTAEKLRSLLIPVPPLELQRLIADFLNDQVTRIDRVIRLRQSQVAIAEEIESTSFVRAISEYGVPAPRHLGCPWPVIPAGWYVRNLGHVVTEFTNGFVGPTRDILRDVGVPYVQSMHIKHGRIDFERRPFFVAETWHRARPRIHLRQGDVLIVQTGDIGQVAVVPAAFGEASCHALQIARANPAWVTGDYLGAYLRSDYGKAAMVSRATGALHPHLEAGVKGVPVLLPPLSIQASVAAKVKSSQRHALQVGQDLARHIELLQERKISLITAAVTGEFDVSTASSRAADVALSGSGVSS